MKSHLEKFILSVLTFASLIIAGSSPSFAGDPYNPDDPYEEQKLIAELVLEEPDRVALRYPTRYEPVPITEPPDVGSIPHPDWPCVEWYATSIEAGFTHDDWPSVGIVAFRESRCNPESHNTSDPSGGSRGILQINGSWRGYLREHGILTDITELHDPLTNFRAGRLIVQYDRDRNRCDWKQWSTKQGLC